MTPARKLEAVLTLAESASGAPDGERLAALSAAERLLGREGLRLRDLARAIPADEEEVREMIAALLAEPRLTTWERGFIASVAAWRGALSEKQRAVVVRLARTYGLGAQK
jgi:hypothetical protein